jgi:hypothetical protein
LSSQSKPQTAISRFIALHPSLWSHWFSATADPDDAAAQEAAIKTAKVIFKYIAETYLETPTSPTPTAVPRLVPKPVVKMPPFLASTCSFQRPTTAATTMPILKCTPQEELADELTRYFNFKAALIEQQGEEGSSDEPSAQEVLLNLLLWWKVSTLFIDLYQTPDNLYSETCVRIPYHCSNGPRLSCHSCNKSFR